MTYQPIWPDVFLKPEAPYRDSVSPKLKSKAALADALEGWALCMAGNKPPEGFGKALIQLADIIGTNKALTFDHAMELAKQR